jgi:hypothetical protein
MAYRRRLYTNAFFTRYQNNPVVLVEKEAYDADD